ncbi:MAG: NlpC/P60 family protein [Thermodesulfovibrionales bacterium]|nr:NlpC/P60 family protein [Thermodesulfovibrionales bacterium]
MNIIVFLFLIILLSCPFLAEASSNMDSTYKSGMIEGLRSPADRSHTGVNSGHKTYKVKRGDTLYSISKKTGVPLRELKRLNRINKDIIKAGQILIIEYKERSERVQIEPSGHPDETSVKAELYPPEDFSNHDQEKTERREGLIQFALSYLDIPYRIGGATLAGMDCSGLVWIVFRNAGIEIPRTVRDLFLYGKSIKKEEMLPGDLVFFYIRRSSEPDHVGIYIGENKFIHASRIAGRVIIAELDSPYYIKRFAGIRRYLEQ